MGGQIGTTQVVTGNGFFIKILTGVAVCILGALVIGIYQFSNWQGQINTRVANIEMSSTRNQTNIMSLTSSINENTRVTAVLAERMQGIIDRMDERKHRP